MNNDLLKKCELKLYDYLKLRDKIIEIFKLFKYLKLIDDKIIIPKITSDYRVRYEQFTRVKSSAIENCVFKNMMLETKMENTRVKLLSKITIALRKLNSLELQVFDLTFYKGKSEDEIMQIISYGKNKVREIKRSACIKFLTALNVDKECLK